MALKFEPTKPFANILVQPRFHPTPLAESAVGVFCIGGGRSSILFFFLSRSLPALCLALSLAHSFHSLSPSQDVLSKSFESVVAAVGRKLDNGRGVPTPHTQPTRRERTLALPFRLASLCLSPSCEKYLAEGLRV